MRRIRKCWQARRGRRQGESMEFPTHFLQAMNYVLDHEGGYVNDAVDRGGPTKFGISQRFLEAIGEKVRVESLSEGQALVLYYKHFYEPNRIGELGDQILATKLLDLMINIGPRSAIRLLQQAVNKCSGSQLEIDGILGSKTRDGVNNTLSVSLLPKLIEFAVKHYVQIVVNAPTQLRFLRGWVQRAYALPPQVCL